MLWISPSIIAKAATITAYEVFASMASILVPVKSRPSFFVTIFAVPGSLA